MTDINLDELERLAKDAIKMLKKYDPSGDGIDGNEAKRFIAAADPLMILALIVRIRKLEAVAEAAEGYAHTDIDDPAPVITTAYNRMIAALAALDAKEET